MVKVSVDIEHFDKVLNKYLKANKRENAYLIETQMKKVLTGISGRKGRDGKVGKAAVQGLKQLFLKARPTAAQIKRDVWNIWRLRVAGASNKTVWTPPPHVDPGGPSRRHEMIQKRIKRRGFLYTHFLYRRWSPRRSDGTRKLIPTKKRRKNTKVVISTRGRRKFAQFESSVAGIVKVGSDRNFFGIALKNTAADMAEYIKRKQPALWARATNLLN